MVSVTSASLIKVEPWCTSVVWFHRISELAEAVQIDSVVVGLFVVGPVVCVGFRFGHYFLVWCLVSVVLLRNRTSVALLFLVPCDCQCYMSLHRSAIGWSAVCDCCISWSYLLFHPFVATDTSIHVCLGNTEFTDHWLTVKTHVNLDTHLQAIIQ